MKEVKLAGGHTSIVDEDDLEAVSAYKWSAQIRPNGNIYAITSYIRGGVRFYLSMHRLILKCKVGDGVIVDHIDGNTLDNRKANLRKCSAAESARNVRKSRRPKTSKYKGVTFDKRRHTWRAQIKVDRRMYRLGDFQSEADAARAYNEAACRLHGNFASLNTVG